MPRPEEFREAYGFDHDCTCAEESEAGEFVVVTPCFVNLTDSAMAAAAEALLANREERAANAQLRIQLKELGVEPRV